jgi:hypothetical protein
MLIPQEAEPSKVDVTATKTVAYRRVPLDHLPSNTRLSSGVFDTDGRRLLASGVLLTDELKDRLRARGVQSVLVAATDYDGIWTNSSATLPIAMRCSNCANRLPIRPAKDEEWSVTWLCKKCQTQYRGHLDGTLAQTLRENIAISKFPIDWSRLQHPPTTITTAINAWMPTPYVGEERRAETRMRITMPVAVVPVDDAFKPVGPPALLITRDISVGGICLLHDEPLQPKYLVVDLPAKDTEESLQLVVEILRCRAVDTLFEIAGRFVMRSED